VSILLPALSQAKAKAKEIECINNRKQCGLLIAMYEQEQNNFMPPVNWGGATVNERWYGAMFNAGLYNRVRLDQYMGCPVPQDGVTPTKGETLNYNMRLSGQRTKKVISPSKKFVMTDSKAGYYFGETLQNRISSEINPASTSTRGLYPWHINNHAGTMLYLDGHVDMLKLVGLDFPYYQTFSGWWWLEDNYYGPF
jgi:prepilin-type processing-associated H-X9-DG protein